MIWADRLQLEVQIGRSAGSTVWKAICVRSGAAKALRLLPETMLLAAGSERDLRAVIERHGAANIEGVVAPEELIVASGGSGIVLPWTEGPSLADLRSASAAGCLPPDETKALLIQLATILQRVHVAGLVHGGIKPTNVFVGGDGRVRLGDFGSSWWVGEALMRFGSQIAVMAAMPYWSFERAMGEPASVADDIHAFGATAYEMLAGRPPVPPNVVLKQMGKPPAAIASRRREAGAQPADLDETLDRLIMSCLAKDPAQRPPSFAAVLEALGVAPADAPVSPPPDSPSRDEPAPLPPPAAPPTPVQVPVDTASAPPPVVAPAAPVAMPEPEPPIATTSAAVVPDPDRSRVPNPPEPPAPEAREPAPAPPPAAAAVAKSATKAAVERAVVKTGSSVHYGEPRKKGSHLPLLLGVVVAAAASGYFLLTRNPLSSPEPASAAPSGTSIVADDLGREIAAVSLDATDETINGLEVKLAESRPTIADRATLEAAWRERRQAIERWRKAQAVGAVEVSSTPEGAEVWVGGERRGTTPLTLAALPKGRFALELRLAGYVPQKTEVAIEGGKSISWRGSLLRAKGTLRVQSSVAGDAFEVMAVSTSVVVARGVTPQDLVLPEGDYRVSVERLGFRTIEQRIEVEAPAMATVDARFAEGRLKATAPEGSIFSVGGAVRGMAPLDLALPPGEHVLSVEYPGGRNEERRVFVQANQTLELRFRAPSDPKPEALVTAPVAAVVAPAAEAPVPSAVAAPPTVAPAESIVPAAIDYDRVFELSEITRRPEPVNTVKPEMPQPFRLRRNGTTGEVLVSAVVDRTGAVTVASVVRSTHPELDAPTLKALRAWRFKPAEKDGRAVAVRVVVPFGYRVDP